MERRRYRNKFLRRGVIPRRPIHGLTPTPTPGLPAHGQTPAPGQTPVPLVQKKSPAHTPTPGIWPTGPRPIFAPATQKPPTPSTQEPPKPSHPTQAQRTPSPSTPNPPEPAAPRPKGTPTPVFWPNARPQPQPSTQEPPESTAPAPGHTPSPGQWPLPIPQRPKRPAPKELEEENRRLRQKIEDAEKQNVKLKEKVADAVDFPWHWKKARQRRDQRQRKIDKGDAKRARERQAMRALGLSVSPSPTRSETEARSNMFRERFKNRIRRTSVQLMVAAGGLHQWIERTITDQTGHFVPGIDFDWREARYRPEDQPFDAIELLAETLFNSSRRENKAGIERQVRVARRKRAAALGRPMPASSRGRRRYRRDSDPSGPPLAKRMLVDLVDSDDMVSDSSSSHDSSDYTPPSSAGLGRGRRSSRGTPVRERSMSVDDILEFIDDDDESSGLDGLLSDAAHESEEAEEFSGSDEGDDSDEAASSYDEEYEDTDDFDATLDDLTVQIWDGINSKRSPKERLSDDLFERFDRQVRQFLKVQFIAQFEHRPENFKNLLGPDVGDKLQAIYEEVRAKLPLFVEDDDDHLHLPFAKSSQAHYAGSNAPSDTLDGTHSGSEGFSNHPSDLISDFDEESLLRVVVEAIAKYNPRDPNADISVFPRGWRFLAGMNHFFGFWKAREDHDWHAAIGWAERERDAQIEKFQLAFEPRCMEVFGRNWKELFAMAGINTNVTEEMTLEVSEDIELPGLDPASRLERHTRLAALQGRMDEPPRGGYEPPLPSRTLTNPGSWPDYGARTDQEYVSWGWSARHELSCVEATQNEKKWAWKRRHDMDKRYVDFNDMMEFKENVWMEPQNAVDYIREMDESERQPMGIDPMSNDLISTWAPLNSDPEACEFSREPVSTLGRNDAYVKRPPAAGMIIPSLATEEGMKMWREFNSNKPEIKNNLFAKKPAINVKFGPGMKPGMNPKQPAFPIINSSEMATPAPVVKPPAVPYFPTHINESDDRPLYIIESAWKAMKEARAVHIEVIKGIKGNEELRKKIEAMKPHEYDAWVKGRSPTQAPQATPVEHYGDDGGLWGLNNNGNNPKPGVYNLFPGTKPTPTGTSGGSLLGNKPTPTHHLFGPLTTNTTPTTKKASFIKKPAPTHSLFPPLTTNTTNENLFSNKPTSGETPAAMNLFPNPKPPGTKAPSNWSLFGDQSAATPTQDPSGLFGAVSTSAPTNSSGLFGAKPPSATTDDVPNQTQKGGKGHTHHTTDTIFGDDEDDADSIWYQLADDAEHQNSKLSHLAPDSSDAHLLFQDEPEETPSETSSLDLDQNDDNNATNLFDAEDSDVEAGKASAAETQALAQAEAEKHPMHPKTLLRRAERAMLATRRREDEAWERRKKELYGDGPTATTRIPGLTTQGAWRGCPRGRESRGVRWNGCLSACREGRRRRMGPRLLMQHWKKRQKSPGWKAKLGRSLALPR
ncbi:hypothetical protein BJ170DRAFT_80682 [Xylariales sp. AK1849]|nr:hypothetical protein BJ170DRAFT_80682 [Xylariales sp. AK1849]